MAVIAALLVACAADVPEEPAAPTSPAPTSVSEPATPSTPAPVVPDAPEPEPEPHAEPTTLSPAPQADAAGVPTPPPSSAAPEPEPEPDQEPEPADALTSFIDAADALFSELVSAGRVDYMAAIGDRTRIRAVLDGVSDIALAGRSANERRAFWLNYYNLRTIAQVVDASGGGLIGSPTDVPGFFDGRTERVAGQMLTLNAVENRFLRPDPRVHFALVCAAKGCPPIQKAAYRPERVQAQLEAATRRALNDREWLSVTRKQVGGRAITEARISRIFEWYADDFGGEDGVVAYIDRYREPDLPGGTLVTYTEYDWTLNAR